MAIESARRQATIGGIPLKHLSLGILTFQNSALILIMHYSRVMPPVKGHRYFTSTAVFLNEVFKLAMSLSMALYDMSGTLPQSTPATTLFHTLFSTVFTGDSWKMAIPALLYTLQNTLQYVAVSNLDAATFQVTYQLKILTTAVFSVALLGRSLPPRKWLALILLMIGVAIVQMPNGSDPAAVPTFKDLRDAQSRYYLPRSVDDLKVIGHNAADAIAKIRRSATYEGIAEDVALQNPQLNATIGLMAVIVACSLSGLAGVYFEKILKEGTQGPYTTLWTRNIQLSFYSLFPALFIGILFKDGEEIGKAGFFAGYNWVVWTAVLFQAVGGVIVSFVINYADNIAKNFSTSISILISFLGSVAFFDFKITGNYLVGTGVVLCATYLYTSQDRRRPPSLRIDDFEKASMYDEQMYMDSASLKPKTPMRGEGLSTSRPGTPLGERPRYFRTPSDRVRRDA